MVIASEEYWNAKLAAERDPKLASLFQLRNTTNHYLIQCLADREIQKVVWNGNNINTIATDHLKSKAYQYNCRIIHTPQNYAKVAAIDGLGWDSTKSKPCGKFRSSTDDTLLDTLLRDEIKAINRLKQESLTDKIQRLQQLLREKEKIIERLITSKKHFRQTVRKSVGTFEKEDWEC